MLCVKAKKSRRESSEPYNEDHNRGCRKPREDDVAPAEGLVLGGVNKEEGEAARCRASGKSCLGRIHMDGSRAGNLIGLR